MHIISMCRNKSRVQTRHTQPVCTYNKEQKSDIVLVYDRLSIKRI